jgi:hypothetical protein
MDQVQGMMVTLLVTAGILLLIVLIFIALFIWLRKPIFDTIKLRKLMWLNYVIVDYETKDKTTTRFVKRIIDGKVSCPDGDHPVIEQAIKLMDRKYPSMRVREGEVLPVVENTDLKEMDFKVACPSCNAESILKIPVPNTPDTKTLDNIVLRAKSEGGLLKWFKENQKLIYIMLGVGGLVIVSALILYDFRTNIGKILDPVIQNAVTTAMAKGSALSNIIATK